MDVAAPPSSGTDACTGKVPLLVLAMLVGRDTECDALEQFLGEAEAGHSSVLALVGEPGIGKTALLDYVVQHATGFRTLRARGIQSETVIPFGGLLELLRPALDRLAGIPDPQAHALAGALALEPGAPFDRFAVGAATLSLLAAYAEDSPVLVVVDDLHWFDRSSAEALRFAARRLVADPIAVLLAAREGEPSMLDDADLPILHLSGIDQEASRELLANASEGAPIPAIVERLYEITAGNPLALLEIGTDVSILDGLPLASSLSTTTRTSRAFVGRSRGLPDRTRNMLVLAAASDDGDLAILSAAAQLLDLDVEDLTLAEQVGLVTFDSGGVHFRHPLARTAIYVDADAAWRREAHRSLAAVLPPHDRDRRAWHGAAGSLGPDAEVSAGLEEAAYRARVRGAFAEAAAAFERAGRFSPDQGRRHWLLYEAADTAWLAGLSDRATRLADEVIGATPEPSLAARVGHLRGQLAMRRGPVMDGYTILREAAESAAGSEPELAVAMLAEAANASFYAGDSRALSSTASRAAQLVPDEADARTQFLAVMVSGMAEVIGGDGDRGTDSIRRAVDLFDADARLQSDVRLLAWGVLGALWVRSATTGAAIIERAVTTAREQVAIGTLPYLLHHVARHQATSDQWSAAAGNYDEAIRLARETGQRTDLAAGLAGLAWLEARQGKAECGDHIAEALGLCAELGTGIYAIWAGAAAAELELGRGRTEAARDRLVEWQQALDRLMITDADLSPAPELVEVCLRLGRRDEALAIAEAFARRANAKGQPWALARSARCQAMLAPDSQYEAYIAQALELHAQTPDAFETARTHLVFGARLRRRRQRVRSREALRVAIGLFDRLGAAPWSDQASAELSATGETARRRDPTTLDQLTPQEFQVAMLLAHGNTTRETASALFLSPKTVEYHLGNIYRKLGVHSREALATEMADEG